MEVCRQEMITGFPTIRVYRRGSDVINVHGFKEHESYHGDRTNEALTTFADSLVPHAGNPGMRHFETRRMSLGVGCQVSGFVLVKKVCMSSSSASLNPFSILRAPFTICMRLSHYSATAYIFFVLLSPSYFPIPIGSGQWGFFQSIIESFCDAFIL